MIVGNMEWKDMEGMVTRRLNTLKMCKSGSIATDYNKQVEKLGKKPAYTKEEREEINISLGAKIQKAVSVSLRDAKVLSVTSILSKVEAKISAVKKDAFIHPDLKAWDKAYSTLQQMKAEREAQLDGDFMDVADEFKLGIKKIEEFPAAYAKLEATEW